MEIVATIMEMVASIMEMLAIIMAMVETVMEMVSMEEIMETGVGGITQDLMLEMGKMEAMELVIVATIMVMA